MASWPADAPHEHSWGPLACHDNEESDWENDAVEEQRQTSRPSPPLPSRPSTSTPSSSFEPPPASISSLDDGALHHVLRFLDDPVSLSAIGASSRRMRELTNDPLSDRDLWKVSFFSFFFRC